MVAVFLAIPLTIKAMTSVHHGDGQQQFVGMMMSWVGGVFAAFIYLVLTTFAFFFVRKRSRRLFWWTEGLILGLFIFLLVYGNL
ncbi:MAG: hypothetical protein JWM68_1264 [Verrucomicrobiales bacterium]|nr:hypothetical protein [Verrucomicrobiales bacterium]